MRLTRYFLPTLKETPAEATIASHRLMLRAGMIAQCAAGIYSWLPLGWRVLKKIENIIHEEQARAGAIGMLMPTLQPSELWEESGRYDAYGPELLRIEDRQGRNLLYGPTNEEMITDIFRRYARSYRDLPRILYHIQRKFRDEVRPRFGVMRGREFLMKDGYSFDVDRDGALESYYRMFVSYLRTFDRMGLRAIPMRAETGPIGGNLSHEFIVLAETGESAVYCHKNYLEKEIPPEDVDYDSDLSGIFKEWSGDYAATDDMHDPEMAEGLKDQLVSARGIEVGQIFYFGTKYSTAMNLQVSGPDGSMITPEMGSYGIGVSRLVGALIEARHDEAGIIWPESVAPFKVGLINLKSGDSKTDAECDRIYNSLLKAGVEVLYDDRDERAGVKFKDMDLIGLPLQVVVGPRGLENGVVEVKRRGENVREEMSPDSAVMILAGPQKRGEVV